jgi:5'-nucleotidase / UDP-sugar diphosphatase
MGFFARVMTMTSLTVALAFAGNGCSDNAGGPTSPCPDGKPCSVRMTFLHTSDIHSRLFPYDQLITQIDSDLGLGALNQVANIGGAARMAYVLGRERARADRVLHLDSGDCFQGAPIFNFFSGEPETRALSAFGLDAAVVGNHEFDAGALNVAIQFQRWANFNALAANYKWEDVTLPNYAALGTVAKPYQVFSREGLKIAVIGMANLSSLGSVFDQPNRLSIVPLSTIDVVQFYTDLLRPYVDLIVLVSHMGLDKDQRAARLTTGVDVIMGGHNHIVVNPPQEIRDCSADANEPGFIWVNDPNAPGDRPPLDDPEENLRGPQGKYDPDNHPYQVKRSCIPRKVVIAHSGAFAKYVGRLDLIVSNDPKEISPTGKPEDYDPNNRFEVASLRYTAFPVNDQTPEDPVVKEMLEPYKRSLDVTADLDILAGYAPTGSRRIAGNGGDSPLGNVVATAMWLRNGIQTDFSLTNSAGIRADLVPGPVAVEQMYNIFPFDNSISKMQLSGLEVQQLFDYVARRSANRACTSQVQIAGARVRINCAGCTRPDANKECKSNDDCPGGACINNKCSLESCAENVYIGYAPGNKECKQDADCVDSGETANRGQCDLSQLDRGVPGRCQVLINDTGRYELATSNYLAGGGSGFRVLQRNTTQFDTRVQQRDALIDYIRQGRPCGWKAPDEDRDRPADGLKACSVDGDCAGVGGDYVCACPGTTTSSRNGDKTVCSMSNGASCGDNSGRCVLRTCRDEVATFHDRTCSDNPDQNRCREVVDSCRTAGEQCKVLSCVDRRIGSLSDGRLEMIGR